MWTCLVIVDEDYIALRNLLNRAIRHSPMKIYKVKHCTHISNHFREPRRTCKAKVSEKPNEQTSHLTSMKNILDAKQHRPMVQRVMWTIVRTMHTSKNINGQILVCENYCDKGPGDRVWLRWQSAKRINLIGATVWEIWPFEVRIQIWINSNLNLSKVCKKDTTG